MKTLLLFLLPFVCLGQPDTIKTPEVIVSHLVKKKEAVSYQNIKLNKTQYFGGEPSQLLSNLTPSITYYNDAGNNQSYSYFRLRGIDQTRINVTLDGVPLNEPEDQGIYFSNNTDLFQSIKSLQIQRGVGLSKNGVASYAGSIELTPNFDTSYVKAGFGVGSFKSRRVFFEFSNTNKNTNIYLRASKISSDGFKDYAFNNSGSFFASINKNFNKHSLKINTFAGFQKNGQAWLGVSMDSINKSETKNGNTKGETDHFLVYQLQLHDKIQKENFKLTNSLFYSKLIGNYFFDLNNYLSLPSDGTFYQYNFNSNYFGYFNKADITTKYVDITTGIFTSTYNREHLGKYEGTKLYKNTGYKNEFSTFLKLSKETENVNIYTDLQFRTLEFLYQGDVKMTPLNYTFINPKVGLSVYNFYYTIGKTNREPTRNDMFGGSDNLLFDSTLNKPMLFITKHESVIDQELGYRFKTHNLELNTNVYYMSFNNEITLNGKFGPNGLALTSSVDKSIRTGLEVDLTYYFKGFKYTNSSSYNYSQIREQSQTFTPILTPRYIINQTLSYQYKKYEIALQSRYQSSSFIDYSNDNQINEYHLINLFGSVNFRNSFISFNVTNLGNIRYFNNGYVDGSTAKYHIQARRNYYVQYVIKF